MKQLLKNINKLFELEIVELESKITRNRAETEKYRKCGDIDFGRLVCLVRELAAQGKLTDSQKRDFAIMGIPISLGSDK